MDLILQTLLSIVLTEKDIEAASTLTLLKYDISEKSMETCKTDL